MAKQVIEITSGQAPFTVNRDLSPYEMPPSYFSDGNNIRFNNGKAGIILGHTQVLGTPSAPPYWAISFRKSGVDWWVYGGLTNLYKIVGTTHSTITRSSGAYTTLSGTENNWNGGILGGCLVITNGLNKPQSFTQSSTVFADLPQWPATLLCKAIVPFKNHLIALNLTDSSTQYPFSLRWSDAIPEGAVDNGADTWDTTSTSSEAGQVSLGATAGHILAGVPLGNELMVYKEDSVYSLKYTGGSFTFEIRDAFKDTGLLAPQAVVDLGDGRHFFVATNDVMIHNGTTIKSVISDQMKTFLFGDIDSTYYYKTFVAHNKIKNEVWICYPRTNAPSGMANRALIWNYNENTWSVRDLPGVNYIAKGVVDPNLTNTWSAASTTWAQDTSVWATLPYNPAVDSLLFCGTNDTLFYQADKGLTFNGTNFTSYLERFGLHAGNPGMVKKISRIFPRLEGNGTVYISVGAEYDPYEGVNFGTPKAFVIGQDYKVDCRVNGRYLAIRFESDTGQNFNITGFGIEADEVSER